MLKQNNMFQERTWKEFHQKVNGQVLNEKRKVDRMRDGWVYFPKGWGGGGRIWTVGKEGGGKKKTTKIGGKRMGGKKKTGGS